MDIIAAAAKDAARSKNIFLPLFENEPLPKGGVFSSLPASTSSALDKFFKSDFTGSEGEIRSLQLTIDTPQRIILVGLGALTDWSERKSHLLSRRIVRFAKAEGITECAVPLLSLFGENRHAAARNFVIGTLMANEEFTTYKETPKNGWPSVQSIIIATEKEEWDIVREGIAEGLITGEEVNKCRNLANTPGGDMTPQLLANAARDAIKKTNVRIQVLTDTSMKRLGMGGVLGVAKGSDEKPKFIIMEYHGGEKDMRPLVLVGKGVTFDTGGINLKPEHGMGEMHMDMSGGAAVIHGIAAIAKLELPINVIGLIPAVENMPSGSSYRPGDILKSMSGKTIEVLNTDAEGRVILADALYYGATKYKPGLMIDFATLTGAAMVALGIYTSAVFTRESDDLLQHALVDVGAASGDYVWPLPMWNEYLTDIKGTFGDVANIGKGGGRWGGAIHGAKFLEQFVGETRWAHIDIAPRMTANETEFLAKGATGVGVRFIVDLAKKYSYLY